MAKRGQKKKTKASLEKLFSKKRKSSVLQKKYRALVKKYGVPDAARLWREAGMMSMEM